MTGTTFLIERYWPGVDEAMLRSALPRLDDAARDMTAEGKPVDHVGSLLMPVEQVVFSVIRAPSEAFVMEVNERAGIRVDHVAPVTSLGFAARGRPQMGEDT